MSAISKRYSTQIKLKEIGIEGQKRLSDARVLVVGAGGLGSPVLYYLAAAGVGTTGSGVITIIDSDRVDESNLQRQILFSTSSLKKKKAKAAKRRLLKLNPSLNIKTHSKVLDDTNASTLVAGCDLIIDCTDNFEVRYLINDFACAFGKPVVSAAVTGDHAEISLLGFDGGACLRCYRKNPPAKSIYNCETNGVLGAFVGIVGSLQALEAIYCILKKPRLKNKVLVIDSTTFDFKTFSISRNPSCISCSSREGALRLLQKRALPQNSLYLDVRELDEWRAGHIKGAKHFPLSALKQNQLPDLPKDKSIVVYCKSGIRSVQAIKILRNAGFTNLINRHLA